MVEPHTYKQAAKDPRWVETMTKEIQALEPNNTWELTILPPHKLPIGCKWVFKIKYHVDGSLERFEARLVAKGCTQKEGIDYKETFALVAKMVTVRALLATPVQHNWYIEQLDINNAFLHGDLLEGQANRQWFTKLTTFLLSLGFKQSYTDTSLFTLKDTTNFLTLLVYMDDILLAGNNQSLINLIKQQLHETFNIKDLGPLHYYLSIEILKNSTSLTMSQRKYALELLQSGQVLNDKPAITPLDPQTPLNDTDGTLLPDPTYYRTLIGKLIYLTITRPYISFAAQLLSQFSHSPRTTHIKALTRVLRYIKLSPSQGLYFTPTTNPKKQSVVSRSSTEAEYRALADCTCEITWLKCLLQDLSIPLTGPTTIYCDNASTIALASNPIQHARTKHIELDCHFVRDKIREGSINPTFIPSKLQAAHVLTKGLCKVLHYNCLSKFGICDLYTLPT
ncbi:retrovirus-related pol polyprotein from transposon TNT 1-94 [Tanacetum coccineum]